MPLTPERRRVLRAEKAFEERRYSYKPRTPRPKTQPMLKEAFRDAISREREHQALIARLRKNWGSCMESLNRKIDRIRYLEDKIKTLESKDASDTAQHPAPTERVAPRA